MNGDIAVLKSSVLALEFIGDDAVMPTTDDALVYRCPWCYRNLFSQNTDRSLRVDIECRGMGAGHVLRFRR